MQKGRGWTPSCKGASSLMPLSSRPGRSVWRAYDEATRCGRPITVIRSPAAEPPLFVTQVDDARVVQCLQKSFGVVPPHVVLQMSPQRVVPQHRLEDGGCVVVRHREQLVHAPADLSWLHDANLSWLFAGKFAAPPKKRLILPRVTLQGRFYLIPKIVHVEMLAAGGWTPLAVPSQCRSVSMCPSCCQSLPAAACRTLFANICQHTRNRFATYVANYVANSLPTLCQLCTNSVPTLCQLFANSLTTLCQPVPTLPTARQPVASNRVPAQPFFATTCQLPTMRQPATFAKAKHLNQLRQQFAKPPRRVDPFAKSPSSTSFRSATVPGARGAPAAGASANQQGQPTAKGVDLGLWSTDAVGLQADGSKLRGRG